MRFLATLLTACMLANASTAFAQANFFEQVSQLWAAGQKDAVRAIGQQRLQQNPNDIAGLLLELEYHFDNYDAANVAAVGARVIEVGKGITTTHFREAFPGLQEDCETLADVILEIAQDPEKFERDRAWKKKAPYMTFGLYLKRLQDDGYFNP